VTLKVGLRVVAVFGAVWQQTVCQLKVPVLHDLRPHQTSSKLHPYTRLVRIILRKHVSLRLLTVSVKILKMRERKMQDWKTQRKQCRKITDSRNTICFNLRRMRKTSNRWQLARCRQTETDTDRQTDRLTSCDSIVTIRIASSGRTDEIAKEN